MFSIEFSGHLFVLLRPSCSLFFFRLFFGLNPVFMRYFKVFPVAAVSRYNCFFFRIFSLLFLPKMIAEKEPKRYLPSCRRTMELSQPKGNDREKKVQKKRTLDGLKSPYKILYMFFIQNNFICPLQDNLVCPLTYS